MSDAASLKGITRWISQLSVVSGLAGAGLAVFYGLMTLTLVPGTKLAFIAMIVVTAVVGTVIGDWFEQRSMRTLRAVADGKLPPDVRHLSQAAQEAARFPDRAFVIALAAWGVGAAVVAVAYRLLPPVQDWSITSSILVLGLGLTPLVSVVTHLVTVQRAREAVQRICDVGLTPAQALQALPGRREQLRLRLLVLTVVSGFTPSLLIGAGMLARTGGDVDELLALEDGAAVAARAAELSTGLDVSMGLLGLVLVAVGIATAVLAGSLLVRPLRSIAQVARRIAAGDLQRPALIPAEDEVWAASAAFASMQAQLLDALGRMRGAGLRISTTTEQLLAATNAQYEGGTEQSVSLNETSATTEELARSARQIAENAGEVAQIAGRTLAAAQTGQRSSQHFFASMLRLKEDNQRIADSVLKLNKRVQQIGKIVEFIHEVGDKSDLLALNAELEGTKAGDVGRGFSLVAAEMRRLAESVIRSTHEIEKLIEEIRDGTNAAVMATESGLKAMETGTQLATTVLSGLDAIVKQARQTSDAVRAISLSTQQQQTGSDQLAEAMAEILRITEDGRAAGLEMAQANQVLSGLAGSLKFMVEQFTFEGDTPPSGEVRS